MARNWEHTARRIEADAVDDLAGHRKLQSPAGQEFVNRLRMDYNTEKGAPLLPWLAREYRKGRIRVRRPLEDALQHHEVGRALPDELKEALRLYDRHFVGALDEPPTHPGADLPSLHDQLTMGGNGLGLEFNTDPEGMYLREPHDLWRSLYDYFPHWADWYHQPDRRKVPIEQLKAHELEPEVERYTREKARRLKDEEVEEGRPQGEVVHSWPDGWSVRRLPSGKALDFEAWQMRGDPDSSGHHGAPICVNWPQYQDAVGEGRTHIYSLRDPQGNPHVTTEIKPTHRYPDDLGEQYPNLADLAGTTSDEATHNTFSVPEGGTITQIQGKGNSIPKPEYQARMKDWFQSFPENVRPNWEYEEPERMDNPADVAAYYENPEAFWQEQDEWADGNHGGYGAHGDYGLAAPPKTVPEVDWGTAIPRVLERDYGGHGPVFISDRADALYKAALERREIPEFAKWVEDFSATQRDNFDEWLSMQPPEANVPWYPADEDEDSPAMRQYYEDMSEWEAEHGGVSAASHLYGLINQHWTKHGDGTGAYENPPAPQTTFSNVEPDAPVRRLWAFSPQSGRVHLHDESEHHPADAPTHESIAADVGEVGLHHGYAYTIPGGWRVLDYDHQPVGDPFVLRTVVEALRKASR